MELNPQLIELYKAWGAITVENLRESAMKKDVHDSLSLIDSIEWNLVEDAIHVMYNYYGMFPDMGVGKGVPISEVRSSDNKRRPKKWYSKQMYREVARLSEILGDYFGDHAMHAVLSERKTIVGIDTIEMAA
jgi:hypothetical protein